MNLADYIRQAAAARGIDPNIALKVALSEGGVTNPTRQSDFVKNGVREPSYGPFQLLIGGPGTGFGTGLGNKALAAGIDPRKPENAQAAIDFALDQAKSGGWGPWYGAARAGIGNREGIGAPSPYAALPDGPKGQEVWPTTPAPSATPVTNGPSGIPSDVAAYAASGETKSPLQGFFSALAQTPDAPPVRFGPMGDARNTGSALLKQLQATPIAQLLLQQRLSGIG
jgi:hypothetical protein